MSTPIKPSYFEQPYNILGYRIVSYDPVDMGDIDYITHILTAPVYMMRTWDAAFKRAGDIIHHAAPNPSVPIAIHTPGGTQYTTWARLFSADGDRATLSASLQHTSNCSVPITFRIKTASCDELYICIAVVLDDCA